MPIKFGPGEKIKSGVDVYVVEEVLSQGAFAHAAKASSRARGGAVFLKRYFSPTRALEWYAGFVRHQQELKRRITSHAGLSQYCYGFIDFFEGSEGRADKTFHQVFEFIPSGKSLAQYLGDTAREGPLPQWERRVSYARVMMMGISALHEQHIVHTDLKPENLLLVPNRVRADVYNLKLIDLDWSIFSDCKAPWHGKGIGYVGTHGYMSPEHLNGAVPIEKSDTYTCALMLSELLTGEHPFSGKLGDDVLLRKAMLKGDFRPFKLPASIGKVDDPRRLEDLVNQAMSPIPDRRPDSVDIKNALFGRVAGVESSTVRAVYEDRDCESADHGAGRALELLLDGKVALRINIDTVVGRQMLKPIHPDAQFLSDHQFRVQVATDGGWTIVPVPGALNETLVDGRRLDEPLRLVNGMRIAVGNASRGIERLSMQVRTP